MRFSDLFGAAFDETRPELPQPQQRALDAALLRDEAEGRVDPRTIATAVVGVLTALAAESPTLLGIDDVQWVDRASERSLAFAARRLPERVGLLLTRRSDGGSEAPLGVERALPEEQLEMIVPGPLSPGALHHLLRDRLGTAPRRPTLVRIAAADAEPNTNTNASAMENDASPRNLNITDLLLRSAQ
jgi:hypothetical protein